MSVDQRIDDLITAGWYVLDSDFEPAASTGGYKRFIAVTPCLAPTTLPPNILKISSLLGLGLNSLDNGA